MEVKKKMRKRDSIILSIGPSGNAIFDVCFAMKIKSFYASF